MKFELVATAFFVQQIEDMDQKSKKIIKDKIELVLTNPFRFKRLHSKIVRNVFRVRLNIQNKETRLIYAVLPPNIILVCLLDRKDDYRSLENYLKRI